MVRNRVVLLSLVRAWDKLPPQQQASKSNTVMMITGSHYNNGYSSETSTNKDHVHLGSPSSGHSPSTAGDDNNKDMSGSGAAPATGDPFSPNFGEEDFDIPPINLPPSALEEHVPTSQQQHYNSYHHHQQQQHMMPHNMYWGGQTYQQMNGYAAGYGQEYHPSSAAVYHGYMYGGPQQHVHTTVVTGGGPSPGAPGSSPSPQAGASEEGDRESEHLRNNNIIKTDPRSPYAHQMQQQQQQQHRQQHPHPHHAHHAHAHHHHHHAASIPKKPKVSKRKKKRDPNEPQKPVSAYALFFRDSQASIKAANPNAAFGDVSKIVASMWDSLDPDSKAAYKKRTENAKKEYLKKLAAYRASLVSKGGVGDGSNPYGPYAAAYASYAEVANSAGLKTSSSQTSSYLHSTAPASAGGYMGQPIPPRPPMQQQQQHQMHHPHHHNGSYVIHHHHHSQVSCAEFPKILSTHFHFPIAPPPL